LGGRVATEVLNKAKAVERAVYNISAALVPPELDELPAISIEPYHPFEWILEVSVKEKSSGQISKLRPLVILDDVHTLHPDQLIHIRDWLAKREMRISRWMLMRLDAQTPEAVLLEGITNPSTMDVGSTIQESREITKIWLQSSEDRAANRRNFKAMAKSMADKKLRLMPVFHRQGLISIQDLLNSQPTPLSPTNLKKLQKKVDVFQRNSNIPLKTRDTLKQEIKNYFTGSKDIRGGEDVELAMLLILLNRYVKRVPQAGLFENESPIEPSKPIKANAGVADGAKIFLLHEYGRPYYYGIDAICHGSSENAEQFLHLAGRLVNASEAKIIKGSPAELPSKYQHQLLQEKAQEIVQSWAFPFHAEVKRLCDYIAQQCVNKSLEPNASLDGGANAVGILDEEFKLIATNHQELAHVLKFGVAYNAFSIKRHYKVKNQSLTLIELTGPILINKGLTFTRGGILERDLAYLLKILGGK